MASLPPPAEPERAAHLAALLEALLHHGGNREHGFGGFERFIDIDPAEASRLLLDGTVVPYDEKRVRMRPMARGRCHQNSAALAAENPDYHLMTGLGMGDPNETRRWDVWRVHSWVVTSEGIILETTVPRRLYVGFLVHPNKPGAQALAQRLRTAYPPLRPSTTSA